VRARLLLAASAAAATILLVGCTSSGDGGRGGTNDFLNRGATVTSDSPSGPEYVSMTEITGDRDSTCVGIEATRAFDVFNASFTITYDASMLSYTGFVDSNTCLGSGTAVLPTQVDAASTPGQVVVGIARNAANTTTGADCSPGELIQLCFNVIGTGSSRLRFTGNTELQDPTGGTISVEWLDADVDTQL
jgi:hypothetical protein